MEQLPNRSVANTIDCKGKMILPTWCDSHTHIVFAGNREQEFVDSVHTTQESVEYISDTYFNYILTNFSNMLK